MATTLYGAVRPSFNVTRLLTGSCDASPAAATTWLLVMMSPSGVRMMPDPSCNSPSPSSVVNVTTLGNTLVAICSTEGLTVDCVSCIPRDGQLPADVGRKGKQSDGCTDRCRNRCQCEATQN